MKSEYVIISSAYNEERNIDLCITSVINQSMLPRLWVIINDGSTDATRLIIEKYLEQYPWIKLVDKQNDEVEFGAHAIINFYIGLDKIDFPYDFVCQLDTDISIDRHDFYEYQLQKFSENTKLGISSGITYTYEDGLKKITRRKHWRTGGATKMYRKECLNDIDGLKPIFSWDGLDVYQAIFRGWESRTFFDLRVNHLGKKRMIDRNKQYEQLKIKGATLYKRGFSFEFMLFKMVQYLLKNPKLAVAFWDGYTNARQNNIDRLVSKEEVKFIRKFQVIRFLSNLTGKEVYDFL